MNTDDLAQLLPFLTDQEREEFDNLLRAPIKVDTERFPFKHLGRYWTSEEDLKRSSQFFPSFDDQGEEYWRKFNEWLAYVRDHSCIDPEELGTPSPILEMINYSKVDDSAVNTHRPHFFLS